MKLPVEFKEKWLEALRSGRFVQGKGQLKKTIQGVVQHCCIAVLGECLEIEINERGDQFKVDENLCEGFYPSVDRLIGVENVHKLVNMNDDSRESFLEIADWIEEHL